MALGSKRCAFGCLVLAIAFATTTPTVVAQTSVTSTVRGSVVDVTGSALPGASVTLTNMATRASRTVDTNEAGQYTFVGVFPGTYALKVELPGLKSYEQSLSIRPQDTVGVDVQLEIGRQTERVAVAAETAIIRTDTGAREAVLTAHQIDTLSTVGRSPLELLRILPGSVPPDPTQLETVSFGGGASNTQGYTMNGVRSSNNMVSLDGSALIDIGGNSGLMLTLNSDMVQELKVQSSNYAAEYGSGGVSISAVTKSGASRLSGTLYDYNRNYRLAANDRSNSITGITRPKSTFNYPGGNIGGPVFSQHGSHRDTLFFFVGLESQRQHLDPGASLGVVPTLRQRAGDMSEFSGDGGTYLGQPITSILVPHGFAGEGSPAPGANLAPYTADVGRTLVNLYPPPNYRDPGNQFNYVLSELQPRNRLDMKVRLDWNVTNGTRAYVRIARETEEDENARGAWWGASDVALPSPARASNVGTSVAGNVVTVLSPAMTNEALVSWSRLRLDNGFKDPSKLELATYDLDLPGPFGHASPYIPGVLPNWGGGVSNLWAAPGDAFAHNDELTFSDKLTRVRGAHVLKFGASLQRLQKQQNYHYSDAMYLVFTPSATPGSTGNAVGDILTGRITDMGADSPPVRGEFRMWNVDLFAQDSWKLRRNVTLEFGLRAGYWPNNHELQGLGGFFDPARYDASKGEFLDPGTFAQLNGYCYVSNGCAPPGLLPNRSPFAMPRVNVAWDIAGDGSNVVRGGYGLFYNRNMGGVEYDQTFNNPPVFYSVTQDAYGGSSYGNGLGLTYSTLPEATLASRIGAVGVSTLTAGSFVFPKTHSFSISYARRIFFGQVVEAGYVGTRGRDLVSKVNGNAVPVRALLHGAVGNADLSEPAERAALDDAAVNAFRPYPAYGAITVGDFRGASDYNSLQVTLSRQTSRPLQYLVAYTLSRTTGTLLGEYGLRDPFSSSRTYGVLPEDRTHILNASWNALLPDGARGPLDTHVGRALLNGWQLSGLSTALSGAPIHLAFTGDASLATVSQAYFGTPDVINPGGFFLTGQPGNALAPAFRCDPRLPGSRAGEKIMNVQCVTVPAFGSNGPVIPPYDLRGPWRITHDLTLFKNFSVSDARKLQFRAAFFDIFNTAWADPNAGDVNVTLDTACNRYVDHVPNGVGGYVDHVCDASHGFSYTQDTLDNFGRINLKRGHRVIELAIKYYF